MNFYPFHIGDYLSHTNHLTDAEDLAYRRMIDMYFQTEQPFNDSSTVARRIRADVQIVDNLLSEFFTFEQDNCWHNKRADEEIERYHSRQSQASKAGKASVQARLNKRSTAVQPTKNQEPLTKNHIYTPEGVNESVWKDFKKLRDRLKAPITETAMKGLIRESEKAKITLEAALTMCCERGWRSFKAEWIENQVIRQKQNPLITNEQIEEAYRAECGKDPKLARFNSYYEMKDYVIKQRELRARTP